MWMVFTIEYTIQVDLGDLGIYPRKLEGLLGILFAPLIHGNFHHIMSNTIPLLVLGASLYFFYPKYAPRVFYQSYFFTNALVWIFARPYVHIGASGLVYSLASFLVFFGLFRRNFKSTIISLLVILFYGGMIYGIMPSQASVSWESHLMGTIVGLVSAYVISLFSKY